MTRSWKRWHTSAWARACVRVIFIFRQLTQLFTWNSFLIDRRPKGIKYGNYQSTSLVVSVMKILSIVKFFYTLTPNTYARFMHVMRKQKMKPDEKSVFLCISINIRPKCRLYYVSSTSWIQNTCSLLQATVFQVYEKAFSYILLYTSNKNSKKQTSMHQS